MPNVPPEDSAAAEPERPTIWLATQNAKKAEELRRILPAKHRVRSLGDVPGGEGFEVVEDAVDFAGNARKKAMAAAAWLRAHARDVSAADLVVADDSGLAVDALGGAPGVRSARYAGEGATDAERIAKLLGELGTGPETRTARFVCCLIAVDLDGTELFLAEGRCEGTIAGTPRGEQGFGYDPVFVPEEDPEARSFAELGPAAKDAISHRGRALAAFCSYLHDRNLHDRSLHQRNNDPTDAGADASARDSAAGSDQQSSRRER